MTDPQTTTLDRLDFPGTLMYHLRQMSLEAAKDGWLAQMEDAVDLLCCYLRPYMDWAKWEEVNAEGKDIPLTDRLAIDRAKRSRIVKKMGLAITVLHQKKVLFRDIDEEEWDLPPEEPWVGHGGKKV